MQKELFFSVFIVASLFVAIKELREFLRHRYLRRFGLPTTAIIVVAQYMPAARPPLMRMDIEYKDQAGKPQQARVSAPDSEDSFDYLVGNEISIRYDPLLSQHCESEAVLYAKWRESPLINALFLLIISGYMIGLFLEWW